MDVYFGWVLVVYGGVFVVGLFVWGMVLDGFWFDWWDVIGVFGCMVGVVVIMYVFCGY